MRITDDNLHGRVVLSADGLAIGEVNKLFLRGEGFAIDGIEVKLRRDTADKLGLKHGAFHSATLEVPAQLVQSVGDVVLLSARLDELLTRRQTDELREQAERQPPPDRRADVISSNVPGGTVARR